MYMMNKQAGCLNVSQTHRPVSPPSCAGMALNFSIASFRSETRLLKACTSPAKGHDVFRMQCLSHVCTAGTARVDTYCMLCANLPKNKERAVAEQLVFGAT